LRTIIRVNHNADNPFLTVSKETIRDTNLDFDSLGFLIYLLAKPDDWRVRPDQLAKERHIGRVTVYRHLLKLIEAGYVLRKDIRVRESSGRFKQTSIYTVYENKQDRTLENVPF
jgi:predicted transcriptional regulator